MSLDYTIRDAGAAGVPAVDVWHTRDGAHWEKCAAACPTNRRRVVTVDQEGRHGFTVVARDTAGLCLPAPQAGDAPQVWVEVDETPPVVSLLNPAYVAHAPARTLAIRWSAKDPNLGPHPIRLAYAEQTDGPWTPIAEGLENSGLYEWKLPRSMPTRLRLRVEAVDRAGNVGRDETSEPVTLDNRLPSISVLHLSPGRAEGKSN